MGPGAVLVDGPHRPPPQGAAAGTMAVGRGIAPSADGALNDWGFRAVRGAGVSLAAASDRGRCPLDSAIWATRRRLARGVGEEFCVRARPSFAAILDVWQEAGPQLWRKRPGDTRRHTGGKLPHRKKSSKTFDFWCDVRWFSGRAVHDRPPFGTQCIMSSTTSVTLRLMVCAASSAA